VKTLRFCWRLIAPGMVLIGSVSMPVRAQQIAAVPGVTRTSRVLDELLSKPVSIDVSRVSIRHAIDVLAGNSGIPLQYHLQSILAYAKPVTVHLTYVPLRAALERVLQGTSLTVVIDDAQHLAIVETSEESRGTTVVGIVTGRVVDAVTKRPVGYAIITLDDSAMTVRTDTDGVYRLLNVSAGRHWVSVRCVGYAQQRRLIEVGDGGTATANFALSSNVSMLDQVVVTATGAQRYRELGHVVTVINADSLVRTTPVANLADLLTARVPGLQVVASGGVVGGDLALRIRGQTTSHLDPQPIVIVDGVRYKSTNLIPDNLGNLVEDQRPGNVEARSPLNDLNVNDIETVEIVKGPSATTLYGPDAANGVIVITTKRGSSGDTRWNVYVHPSLHSSVPDDRFTGLTYYQAFGHDSATGETVPYNCTLIRQYQYHQCIQDSIRLAPTQATSGAVRVLSSNRPQGQVGLNVSGGVNALRYFLSGDYDTEDGPLTIPASAIAYYRQIHGTGDLPAAFRTPNTQQSVGLHSSLSADVGQRGNVSVTATYNQSTQRALYANFLQGLFANASIPPGADTTQYLKNYGSTLTYLTTNVSQTQVQRVTGSLNGNYQLFPWLNSTMSAGTDLGFSTDANTRQPDTYAQYDGGQASDYRRTDIGRTLNLGLTAMASPGIWSFRSSLGVQYTYAHVSGLNTDGFNLAPGSTSISTATQINASQLWSETISLGTYGEEVIGWRNRLFLNGALRIDGSTSYGDAYRPRPYPKVGLSWIASDEPWLHGLPGLDQLRFRYSFGAASRAPTSAMKLGAIASYQTTIEGRVRNAYERSTLANPRIGPERTRESEYGMDATLLHGTIDASLTGYSRRTDEQINNIFEPNGLPTPQWVNTGDVTGHGVEVSITAHLIRRPTWNADIAASYDYQTTKLVRLSDGLQNNYSMYGGLVTGYPLGAAFGQTVSGVEDTVGNRQDSIIFSKEVVLSPIHYLGVLFPPKTVTFNPSLSLRSGRVRVSTLVDRATGFIQQNPFLSNGCADAGLCLAGLLKGSPLDEQAAVASGITPLEPGDYTRWREFSVTTTVPIRIVSWLKLGSLQVSIHGRNLALWSKYKGPDPESQPGSGITGLFSSGGAFGVPFPRTWSIRFDVLP